MNYLDILLAIPLAYYIYKGYRRGLIFEVAALAGILVGCFVAIRFSKLVSDILPIEGEGTILVAFFILFVGVVLLSRILARAAEGIVKLTHTSFINKILGATLGFIKTVCVLSVMINFVMIIDENEDFISHDTREASLLFVPVHHVGNKMTEKLKTYVDEIKAKRENDTPTEEND